ncbi:hypothetical protein Tco_0360481 [Tanacetum coccineum]
MLALTRSLSGKDNRVDKLRVSQSTCVSFGPPMNNKAYKNQEVKDVLPRFQEGSSKSVVIRDREKSEMPLSDSRRKRWMLIEVKDAYRFGYNVKETGVITGGSRCGLKKTTSRINKKLLKKKEEEEVVFKTPFKQILMMKLNKADVIKLKVMKMKQMGLYYKSVFVGCGFKAEWDS